MTPEGKTKQAIGRMLARYGDDVWSFMPVLVGYGKPTLDYVGCVRGLMFAIEAKKPGGKLTPRQEGTMERMTKAGARVFLVNDEASLQALEDWIVQVITISARTTDLAEVRGLLPVVEY